MSERRFYHPILSVLSDPQAVRVTGQGGATPPLAPAASEPAPKPELFALEDIGLARGAVPAEIWDWKRRHP